LEGIEIDNNTCGHVRARVTVGQTSEFQ